MEDSSHDVTAGRTACTECQRRKQKCSREWPCNHCQRRKVADKCRFKNVPGLPSEQPSRAGRKKRRNGDADGDQDEDDDDVDGPGFEAIGYMTTNLFASLGMENAKTSTTIQRQFWSRPEDCPQLERALGELPARQQMDSVVQIFLSTVNFHYYIAYPPVFLREYQAWWDKRTNDEPLSVQWTCLILMVCAVTTQHLDIATRRKLELDWGEKTHKLTERYHTAARELSSVVPVGYHHLYNIQALLHSCYWYKAEARFLECWHVLSTTVREAQELGLHRDSGMTTIPEFELEIRRRLWCIVDTWDWQVSSGLGRPTIVDRSDSDAQLPALTLEAYSPAPLLYMKMQSELIRDLAARFRAPKYVTAPEDVREYTRMVERWVAGFPKVYAVNDPDKTSDAEHPWIPFHRYYLYTMAYLLIGNPIRAYMAKVYRTSSPPEELAIRSIGIYYSLRQIRSLKEWTDHITRRDGRFHFIIFAILDTGAVLCTAIINDADNTIPAADKEAIYDAIDTSVAILKRLVTLSETARTSYDILNRLARRVPKRPTLLNEDTKRKRARLDGEAQGSYLEVTELHPSPNSGIGDPEMTQEMFQLFQFGRVAESPNTSYNSADFPAPASTDSFTDSTGFISAPPSLDGGSLHSVSPNNSGVSLEQPAMGPQQVSYMGYQMPPADPSILPGLGYGTISQAELQEFAVMYDWSQGNIQYQPYAEYDNRV